MGYFFFCRSAVFFYEFNDQDGEDESCDSIEGVVPVNSALGQSHNACCVFRERRLGHAHRCYEGFYDQGQDGQEQCRREDLADTVDQFGRADGEPPRDDEENNQEGPHNRIAAAIIEQRANGDFIGNRAGSRNSESRANG